MTQQTRKPGTYLWREKGLERWSSVELLEWDGPWLLPDGSVESSDWSDDLEIVGPIEDILTANRRADAADKRVKELESALDQIYSWLVAYPLTMDDGFCQSVPNMEKIARYALSPNEQS